MTGTRRFLALIVAVCLLLSCGAAAIAEDVYPMEDRELTLLTTLDAELPLFGFK